MLLRSITRLLIASFAALAISTASAGLFTGLTTITGGRVGFDNILVRLWGAVLVLNLLSGAAALTRTCSTAFWRTGARL
jgi:hypothetical protein